MKAEYEQLATNLLKSELARRGLSYEDLRIKLLERGIEETRNNLTKKIYLGKFSFAFFLQCAEAIGLEKLQLK